MMEILKLLLAAGANVNARNFMMDTPLHYAAGYSKAQINTFIVVEDKKHQECMLAIILKRVLVTMKKSYPK